MRKLVFAMIFFTVILSSSLAEIKVEKNEESILKNTVTREEFFAMLGETSQTNISGELNYIFEDESDVDEQYKKYVYYLANEKIINGTIVEGKSYLEPKREITRMEAAVTLTKFLKIHSTSPCELCDIDIPDWASDYISTAVNFGMMSLDERGYFNAKGLVLKSDAIQIIEKLNEKGYFDKKNQKVYAGNGISTLNDGDLENSSFFSPTGIIKYKGSIYVADTKNNVIRKITNKEVSTVAGTQIVRDEFNINIGSFADGKKAKFDSPSFLATPKDGILISDTNNNLIRYFANGKVSTYAGSINGGYRDGKRTKALFKNPTGIVATDNGIVYIADTGNNVIRKIDRNNNVTTYAGIATAEGGYKDGTLKEAKFNRPMGLWLKDGALYVADCGNQRIRKIEDGVVSTVAGGGDEKYDDSTEFIGDYIDGNIENSRFNFPQNIIVDDNGNIYVADTGNSAIRKIDNNGNVYTVLGLSSNDKVEIINPVGLMIENDRLYITDTIKNNIVVIDIQEVE